MVSSRAGETTRASSPAGIGEVDFDRVSGYIQDALEYGHDQLTLDEVRKFVRAGTYQLWAGTTSVLVTEITDFPRERVLHFVLAGGIQSEIAVMLPPILAWGKSRGATRATFLGRRGWERAPILKDWKATRIYMERPL